MTIEAWIGITVLLVYGIAVLIIGVLAYKKTKYSVMEYVTASSTMGLLVLLFTYTATYHSAYAFMGTVGWVYKSGVTWWVNGLWTVLPGIAFYVIGRRVWALGKKRGYLSIGDYVGGTYDSRKLSFLVGIIGIVFVLPYVTMQAQGMSYIFSAITKGALPFYAGLIFFIGILTTYIFLGGVRGVAWTDFLQGMMMLVVIPLGGLWVVSSAFGGLGATYQQGAAQLPKLFSLTMAPQTWISIWITITIGMIVIPHVFLRYLLGRSLRIMKWAAVGTVFYLTFIFVFVPAVGIGSRMALPGLAISDRAFPMMLVKYTPFGFAAIAMAGAIAASMSTAGSQLHAVASQATMDIYDKVKPGKSKRTLFNIARGAVIGFGVLSLILAFCKVSFINLLILSTGGIATMAPAVIGPLYWKEATTEAAFSSIILGLITLNTFQWIISPPLGISGGLWGIIVSTVVFVIVSYATETQESVRKHANFLKEIYHF